MVKRTPKELKLKLEDPKLTEAGRGAVQHELTSEERRQQQINAELQRRQLLIGQGLREPSKEEQARAEIMGITPEQREVAEQKKQQQAIEQQQPVLESLKQKQVSQQQALEAEFPEQEPLTTSQRNVLAGAALSRNLLAQVGIESAESKNFDKALLESSPLIRGFLGTVGVVGTAGFGPVRLTSIFAPESASIANLQSDVSNINQESKFVARMATSKEADVLQALKTARTNEAKVRNRYNQALQDLRKSPQDIRKNLGLLDGMKTDLTIAQGYTQMLERYSVTLNPAEIVTATNDLIS